MNPVFRLVSASIAASPLAGYLITSHIAGKWGSCSEPTVDGHIWPLFCHLLWLNSQRGDCLFGQVVVRTYLQ